MSKKKICLSKVIIRLLGVVVFSQVPSCNFEEKDQTDVREFSMNERSRPDYVLEELVLEKEIQMPIMIYKYPI
jgi:hypothetical protein